MVFVALFTVAFGRLFCGWACPQTVFMEQVFRRIEYAIEGDWKQQMALNKAPFTTGKVMKKTVKHVLFFAISFLIGNTFLAYIIGSDELMRIMREPPAEHTGRATRHGRCSAVCSTPTSPSSGSRPAPRFARTAACKAFCWTARAS
jgi:hypothetical protein